MLLKDKIHPVAVLEEANVISQQFISQFAESDVFLDKVTSIFGNRFDSEKLNYFRQSWLNGNFEQLPEIEIRSQEELNGANGAFAVSTNKIYLSEEYISQNSFNSGAIVDVLLEEIGHFIDTSINEIDTVGDEGEIFSATVQGLELDKTAIKTLKKEDDIAVINLGNENINVEQDNENQNILTYDDVEISFRAFIPSPAVSFGDNVIPGSFAFGGDNRDFQYSNPDAPIVFGTPPVKSRAYQNVIVNVDPSRTSPIVGKPETFWGETKEYFIDDIESVPDKPLWWTKPKAEVQPIKKDTLQATEENNNIEVKRISDDEIEVKLTVDGGIPLLPDLAPNINSEFSIFIREEDPLGIPEYRFEGKHDGFPAYELYINGERVYEHDPISRSQNPLSLVPPMDWDTPDTGFKNVPYVLNNSNLTLDDVDSSSENTKSILIEDFITEINEFFSNLANTIDGEIFSNDIPLIGNIFSNDTENSSTEPTPQSSPIPQNASENTNNPLNFIQQIQEAIVKELKGLQKLGAEEIKQALNNALGETGKGLNILKNISDKSNSDEIKFDLELGSEKSIVNKPLAADIGLPFLGLKIGEDKESQLKVGLDYDFNFTFGVDRTTRNFIFETPDTAEDLKVNLEASIPDLEFKGKLGFLDITASDEDTDENSENEGQDVDGDGTKPSSIKLGFSADFNSENGDIQINPVEDNINLNLQLASNLIDSEALPSLQTDLNLNWNNFLSNINPELTFNNIEVDLGSFVSTLTGPTFKAINKVAAPVKKVTDVISTDLPIIKTSLLDIVEKGTIPDAKLDPNTRDFIEALGQVNELIELSEKFAGDGSKINLGGFKVDGIDINNITTQNLSNTKVGERINIDNKTSGSEVTQATSKFKTIIEKPKLSIPILENPEEEVFKLLLNQGGSDEGIDLLRLNLGTLGLELGYEIPPVPVFGPVTVAVGADAAAAANLNFGVDTNGLYLSSENQNKSKEGVLPNEDFVVGAGAGIKAIGEINLGFASGGPFGGINGYTLLDLENKNSGNKTPIDFKNPGCIFELNGGLDAIFGVRFKINFGLFSYTKRITLIRETIADFSTDLCYDKSKKRGLAEKKEDGILHLSVGDKDKQLSKDNPKPTKDDFLTLISSTDANGNPAIVVRGYSAAEEFTNVNIIKGIAGDGNDVIDLGSGILAAASLEGGEGDDELQGGDGNDMLRGGDDADGLHGGLGNDELYGDGGDDFLAGEAGNDTLNGGNGFDSVSYAEAPNPINFNLSGKSVTGDDGYGGTDTLIDIEQIEGSNHNDIITGSRGYDVLDGAAGNDSLVGLEGNDLLIGAAGADTMDGGEGNDAVSYLSSKAPVNINLETGLVFSAGGEADGDVLIDIESIEATIYDDILIGNDDDNQLYGSEGDDEIIGGAGNDTLSGGGVRDFSPKTNLSPGEDLLTYKTSPGGVEVSLKNGRAKNDGHGNKDTIEKALEKKPGKEFNKDGTPNSDYSSFENLEGSNFNDTLLEGDIGNNKIEGLSGDDVIKGDQGDDTLIGGAGADNLDGGSGFDWADYSDSPEGVSVNLNENSGKGGHAEGDTFERNEDNISTVENLLGSDYDDSLVGDNGNNKINPGLGNGTDFVDGLEGSDRLIIDYSRDDIGTGITGGYTLIPSTGITGGFDFSADQSGYISRNTSDGSRLKDAVSFKNIEEIQVIGTIKDDEIYGGVGNDIILTGAGNDTIYGGQGNNIIKADDGDDIVVDRKYVPRGFPDDSDRLINSDGGRGIDTLSVDLPGKSDDIVLEGTSLTLENPNQLLSLSDGSVISNYEIFKDISTGSGNDKLTQLGRIDNSFQTGDGDDIINPGLGFDRVNGGGSSISYGVLSSPDQGNLLILDYSVEDTGTGIFYFNDGGERDNVSPEDITNFEYLIENTNENELSKVARDYVSIRGFYARASADKANILDQVEFNNFERFNITGTSKTDYLVGGSESDILIGKDGKDILVGNYGSDTLEGGNGDDILIGTFIRQNLYPQKESDALTGGEGADQFWLGISKSAYKIGDDLSSTSSNDNYALITDFNPNEGDTINLYSCDPSNPQEYSLGSSPQNLPLGTAIFSEDNLVAIVQGANNLSLDGDYFSFVQDGNCPPPVKPVIYDTYRAI